MDKLSCPVCQDLIPLVRDGIASEESCLAVEEHIQSCENCKKLYEEGPAVPAPDSGSHILKEIQKKLRFFLIAALGFALFFGLSLTVSDAMFYNAIIMPVIGTIGYILLGWKAVYQVPVLLFVTHLIVNLLPTVSGESLHFMEIFLWDIIYVGLSLAGVLIGGLLHFGLRKEKQHEK